ncbi:hypothetical protein LUZ60_011029 [Juncus effusus]|nr:hypothetical protein LUZ60_011029 [Juncus effusus]
MKPTTSVLALSLLLSLLAAPFLTSAAVTSCSDVYSDLMPCLTYVQYGGAMNQGCCDGVKSLMAAASARSDRQTTCKCIKNVASNAATGDEMSRAMGIPRACGISMPYKMDPNTDCNKIK